MLDSQRHIMVVISNMHCSLVAPAIPIQLCSPPQLFLGAIRQEACIRVLYILI